jgi:hypothetical protein
VEGDLSGLAERARTRRLQSIATAGLLIFAVDVFDNNVLIRRMNGSAALIGPQKLRIEWGALQLGSQAGGVTTLRVSNRANVMQGTESTLGGPSVRVVFAR